MSQIETFFPQLKLQIIQIEKFWALGADLEVEPYTITAVLVGMRIRTN